MLLNMMLPKVVIEDPARLPKEYQEVEYIQSSGTQYIDTGIQPTLSTKVMFGINMTEVTGYVIAGDYTGNDAADWRIFNANGNAYFDIGSNRVNGGTFAAGTYYDVEAANHYVKLNGNTVAQGGTVTSNVIGTFTIKVFYSTVGGGSKGKLYYLRIYNDKTLLREFIPCYRKSDNVTGMYDLVTGAFYGNAGSGSFIVGPDTTY